MMGDARKIAAGLTPAQKRMLLAVCKTNGGGLPVTHLYSGALAPPWNTLSKLGLVQGKSGRQEWAVHTRLGLAVRDILKEHSK